ncbi:murein hydrolase activator EnvC family protein [Paenalcaligenes faecalis]|uniref:murein hydrolase activator EnvC family protein n=1 Tax=Paenalcaligenes faecalis TaxID=2980099 RepID=UPI0022B99E46|nr:peptidoglycan DD-metalloendopeptidase family protein [Paenalcaligenes faecalis]
MKIRTWVLVVGLALGQGSVWANQNLSAQQADARKQRAELQQRISQLQKTIESTQSDKKDAASALRDVESRISETDRELNALQQRQQRVQAQVGELQKQIAEQQKKQEQGQQQLAEQLRAQYASGLSPWTALLSGNDPQEIQRDLGYLAYIAQAQADQVRALQQGVLRLEQLHTAEKANQAELQKLAKDTEAQKQQLQKQQSERETVLLTVESQLKEQQQQAKNLANNDVRLGQLITGLEQEIARQAELRRQAEERRKAEEARRRAEQARLAAEEQQRKAEQARADDERKAEEARLYALAHTPAQPAEPAPEPTPAPPAAATSAPVAAVEPAGGFTGLKRGLQPPVRGEIQGRFGTERPEGGPWRGIILRTAAGTPVKAISAGRVVFSNWMSGFGNLLIIDHGAGFLSIYGHNQSMLKQVGDVVQAGEAVARVGATGGQIEPGVYFEIRQNGQPVNPQLWLGN